MRRRLLVLISLLALVALVASACGSGGDDGDAPDGATAAPPDSNGATEEPSDPGQLSASLADGWSAIAIGPGTKPALALDGSGSPAITYIFEDIGEGFVAFAAAADGWTPDFLVEGYFYGPIDIAFDPQDRPNIVYHDHQAPTFDLSLGELTYALRDGGEWTVGPADDDGHDGWDSTLVVGADGVVRAAGIDPSQFDGVDGIEYYELQDGTWTVTAIGSGPIAYEFNVSLALSPDGQPALSYYNDRDGDLIFASFDGSAWTLETVASEGDVGKFSSLQFDAQGGPHISYYEDLGGASGRIMYAVREGGSWTVEEIGTLDDASLGMTGARRNSALALDAGGFPHVVFSDQSAVYYATRTETGWQSEEIVSAGERPLGQLVSFKLDAAGTPHLTLYEVTNANPLQGLVAYLTRG